MFEQVVPVGWTFVAAAASRCSGPARITPGSGITDWPAVQAWAIVL